MDGSRLKRLRQSRGFSAKRLADRIGISAKHIYAVEAGRYTPRLSLLERAAEVLCVPLAWFFLPDGLSDRELAAVNLSRFSPRLLTFLGQPDAPAYLEVAADLAEAGVEPGTLAELAGVVRRLGSNRNPAPKSN